MCYMDFVQKLNICDLAQEGQLLQLRNTYIDQSPHAKDVSSLVRLLIGGF